MPQIAFFTAPRRRLRCNARGIDAFVPESAVTRTLLLALRSVGGRARLAACLQVSEASLEGWLEGRAEPPTEVYLRALDLVAKGPFAA